MGSTATVTQRNTYDVQKWGRRQVATIALLCSALFLDAMNTSSVNVALPTIGAQLRMSPATLQWVVSGYVLGFGGFLLLGGRAADLLGRRRVFLGGLQVFAVASAVGGVADSGTLLIAASFLKGVGAAFTIPAGLSILTTTFTEGAPRNTALGAWGATGAAGFTLSEGRGPPRFFQAGSCHERGPRLRQRARGGAGAAECPGAADCPGAAALPARAGSRRQLLTSLRRSAAAAAGGSRPGAR